MTSSSISRWVQRGLLHRLDFGLYALGHLGGGHEARLAEALLRGGPGAVLSHVTAACWRELLRFAPERIHVSAPGSRRSRPGVIIHHPRTIHREWHRGLPVTGVTQTLIQIAPMVSDAALRRALAQADRSGRLDIPSLKLELARGPRGATRLRHAIEHHMPQLADTLSPLEDRFFLFCERQRIPLPEPNVEVSGYVVDALWRDARVAVELDGREEHGTPAAVVRDRRRELALRDAKLNVIRYSSEQIDLTPEATARDLKAALRID